MEAHSGYSFCGFAALVLLGHEDVIDHNSLLVHSNNKIFGLFKISILIFVGTYWEYSRNSDFAVSISYYFN